MTTAAKKKSQNPLDYDPTRTTMLRRQFGAAVLARLDRISRRITQEIEREDAFGLKPTLNYDPSQPRVPAGSPQGGEWRGKTTSSGSSVLTSELVTRETISRIWEKGSVVEAGAFASATTGELVTPIVTGTTHSVDKGLPGQGGGPTIDIHTHPDGSSFSDADWGMMGWGANKAMVVITKDKIYTLDKTESSKRASPRDLRDRWNSILEQRENEFFATSESISIQADKLIHAINTQMSSEFGIEYKVTLRGPTANRFRFTLNARWQFKTTPEQVEAFETWIQEAMSEEFFSDTAEGYWEEFIRRGYEQGAGRAFDDAKIKGGNKNLDFYRGKKSQFLESAFAQPVSKERVQLLAGRVLTDLKGFTQAMATQMSRQLVDGLVKGESPRTVARRLTNIVQGNKSRALTIARTETIRAHAEGQLDALEMMGVTQIGVAVEWSTAKFNVCPLCVPLEGVVFSVKEARGMLPRHPNCRCAFLPANVGETGEAQQKKTKASKQAAIDESIKEEIPDGSKRTLKEQKKRTSWSGADLKPEDAPKSILDD